MTSDNEISAPSTPSGSIASQASLCAADISITTIGSSDSCGHDCSRRDSVISTSFQGDTEVEKHPKGKRKRTAAKDKAILEDAYRNNPKPDKWARLDIVERVSLNEKEVQIWFQNRRQNDRRKSRPLSPQEIAALRSGSMQILSTDPYYTSYNGGGVGVSGAGGAASSLPPSPGTHPSNANNNNNRAIPSIPLLTPDQSESGMSFREFRDAERCVKDVFSSLGKGYLSQHRWSISGGAGAGTSGMPGLVSEAVVSAPSQADLVSRGHAGSNIHIALSLDGKAELVPQREHTPPHLPQPCRSLSAAALPGLPLPGPASRPPSGLQRSHSALSLPNITLPPISTLTSSLSTASTASTSTASTSTASMSPSFAPPRLGRGRSRDAHAWELCADADAPDELTAQAENEANGSALAAISLLRSASGPLQAGYSKRNAVLGASKKSKFDRSLSSLARLQSLSWDDVASDTKDTKTESSKIKVSMLLAPSGGDSDKENWNPDEQGNPRQPIQPRPRRPISSFLAKEHLDQNARRLPRIFNDVDGHSNDNGNGLVRRNSMPVNQRGLLGKRRSGDDRLGVFEDGSDGENHGKRVRRRSDEDIERFMKGEVSPSKKPDLDCITGLLSLSQGNWR